MLFLVLNPILRWLLFVGAKPARDFVQCSSQATCRLAVPCFSVPCRRLAPRSMLCRCCSWLRSALAVALVAELFQCRPCRSLPCLRALRQFRCFACAGRGNAYAMLPLFRCGESLYNSVAARRSPVPLLCVSIAARSPPCFAYALLGSAVPLRRPVIRFEQLRCLAVPPLALPLPRPSSRTMPTPGRMSLCPGYFTYSQAPRPLPLLRHWPMPWSCK